MYKVAELFDEAHVPVDGDLSLNVDSSDYFEALVSLLDKTSSRTIGEFRKQYDVNNETSSICVRAKYVSVNYIHWNFLSKIIETILRVK